MIIVLFVVIAVLIVAITLAASAFKIEWSANEELLKTIRELQYGKEVLLMELVSANIIIARQEAWFDGHDADII